MPNGGMRERKKESRRKIIVIFLLLNRLFGQYRKFSDTGTLDIIGVAYGF